MAINQGLRQGPMTSTDTPPPQHTLILSGRLTRAQTLLQTWNTTASSHNFVVYVPIPQKQLSQKSSVYIRVQKAGFRPHPANLIAIKQFIQRVWNKTGTYKEVKKPLHSHAM